MTAIAWNEDVIAWESRVQSGGLNFETRVPKVRVILGKVYAFSGDIDAFDHVIKWEQDGCDLLESVMPETEWTLVVWAPGEDPAFYTNFVPMRSWTWPVHAIGSGANLAIAAMRAGADPRRAVEIACELDPGCGGPVHTLNFKDVLGTTEAGKKPIRLASVKK